MKFNIRQREQQIIWRNTFLPFKENGTQNGKEYNHIIPKSKWKFNLWKDIRTTLPLYLKKNNVQKHSGVHNLLSSWVLSANLYFPVIQNLKLRNLMLKFLQQKVSSNIVEILEVKLEFSFPKNDDLHPAILLGEQNGSRGSGQTSPDVAFIVKTKDGEGIILTECKFTEHSFYRCSARRKEDKGDRKGNPNPNICMLKAKEYKSICHQTVWERKYWDLLNLSSIGEKKLHRCPAATAGYQLFRQQALAEGIVKSEKYNLVVSSVAFDERNKSLIHCLKTTGVNDFQTDWSNIFNGETIFKTWTHQEWVQFVRTNQKNGEFNDWLVYLKNRYNY